MLRTMMTSSDLMTSDLHDYDIDEIFSFTMFVLLDFNIEYLVTWCSYIWIQLRKAAEHVIKYVLNECDNFTVSITKEMMILTSKRFIFMVSQLKRFT